MIVPEFWAEAKIRTHIGGKQFTVKRYGWSDTSEEEALANAQARAEEAIKRVEAGEKVRKIDHKVAYNGEEGLPIREEIISRHDDAVVTRNTYGALCLNTPNVMFADVDYVYEPGAKLYAATFLILFATMSYWFIYQGSWKYVLLVFILSAITTSIFAYGLHRLVTLLRGGQDTIAIQRIKKTIAKHPAWHIRVYKTPMGYRLLVMHKTFDPRSKETLEFLQAIGSDPQYVRMCKNQNCFRARLTAKPWRIGVGRLGPRPGVWPIKPERMAGRQDWVKNYEQLAKNFAACRFLQRMGSDTVDPRAKAIQKLHDEVCQSDSELPIA